MQISDSTIILCGGPINYTNLPIGTNLSNAMIPVNGKPVIGWILDDLLAKGIRYATVVLREQDHRLQSFLQRAYAARMQVRIAQLRQEGTIIQSLQAGLERVSFDGLVRIVLGDTLIRDPFEGDMDFVYVGQVEDSLRWCLAWVDEDGIIKEYADKQETGGGFGPALAGYYHLKHGDWLGACVNKSIAAGERELSDVLKRYASRYPIYARPVLDWYDFGHIDHLVDARRRLLQPRYFNSLSINPILNTITKTSEHDEKLRDELDWYLNIPQDLKVLAPRLVSQRQLNGRLEIVQEYYGYPTLAELYVYADLSVDMWRSILRHVLRIHAEFRRYPGELSPADIEMMYVDKTWERLDALQRQDTAWQALLARDEVCFNGRWLTGIGTLQDRVADRARALARSAPVTVIHGDLCFSNILFDVNNQIIRLIDPRGCFGRKGIFGDARYDIAKLRHSVHEYYDYILADLFDLRETPSGYEAEIWTNGVPQGVGAALDRVLVEEGYDLEEIKFIEGLLFISMLPLHQDHPPRQMLMYLTGLTLLDEVL